SQYNFISLAAAICPIFGCFLFLMTAPGEIHEDTGVDGGPSQIWIMAFSIFFLYFDMLLELRVMRHFGVTVNIISNITRRILCFMLIFALALVGFTHALMYVLHTRRYRPCENDSCEYIDYPPEYPTEFFSALSATYFFLAGRYEPINVSFEKGTYGFKLMMVVFYFYSSILFFNILIEVETHVMTKSDRKRSDYYPKQIYYWASEEQVVKFHSKYSVCDASSGSYFHGIDEVKQELANLKEHIASSRDNDEVRQELANLKAHVASSRDSDDVKQELVNLKAQVASSRDNDEVKQELVEVKQELGELKELVKNLVSQLKANVSS
ncbi:hypothetical protein BGZ65_000871, partial [Modicella reniformis]